MKPSKVPFRKLDDDLPVGLVLEVIALRDTLNQVIDYLPEKPETQETEEKILYKCGGFCGGLHGPDCKVAKPQDEPKETNIKF